MITGCTIKTLPDHEIISASKTAVEINPANAPSRYARIADLTPMHIALLTSVYWGAAGVHLGVAFMEATSTALQNKILSYMNKWANSSNVKFTLVSLGSAQVRISRGPGGYWSYLGTQILNIPQSQPTMNLEQFSLATPESEYDRVVTHETGHCLDGDTLIDGPRDLRKHPQGIPIRELVGQTPWVYAWKDGSIVIRKASRVWLSKRAVPTLRVRLSAGRGFSSKAYLPPLELVGTADHPVLLSDGVTWKNLGDLQPGDRVCSLYRSKNGERSRIRWTGQSERVREHVFVAEQVYGLRPDGCDCHHKNERKDDQSPDNLQWKLESEHHSDHGRGRSKSDYARQRTREVWAGRHHTESSRKKMSESHTGKTLSDETKARMSAATKGKTQSEELIAKRRASMARFYANGGKSGMFGKTASPETRSKRSATMKETLARKRGLLEPVNHMVISIEEAGIRDVFDMTVPDAECFVANGVVVHNCLGFPHEHMRADIVKLLDPAKTIAYFGQDQGWSPTEVEQQVLTPLDESSLMGTPVDETSIMCYQIPGVCTINGQPIPGGTAINSSDYAFAAKIYPQAATISPPVAPPVTPPVVVVTPPVTPPVIPPATTTPVVSSGKLLTIVVAGATALSVDGTPVPLP